MSTFCYDKREGWDQMGQPDTCFIMAKHEKYYVLVHLDSYDYYPWHFEDTPIGVHRT